MPSTHPLMLGLRFVFELSALVAFGRFGFEHGGLLGAVGLPLIAAAAWGLFNVPGDPSRSGRAPIAVPGLARLALELAFFAGATGLASRTEWPSLAWWVGLGALALYAVGFDRVSWLLRR